MTIAITNRFTNDTIYISQTASTIREAVEEAVRAGNNLRCANLRCADLRGADLTDANLAFANLPGADLRDADLHEANLFAADLRDAYLFVANLTGTDLRGAGLARANLHRADLSGADLRGADLFAAHLTGANLQRANLTGASLQRANLFGADLRDANLSGANLSDANLSDANLSDAILTGANLAGIIYDAPVPAILKIHQAVLKAVTTEGCGLNMREWHTCATTHCRAGWVIHLAGEAGRELEEKVGTPLAAALIYRASDPTMRKVPDFYCSNFEAMKSIREAAEREAAETNG